MTQILTGRTATMSVCNTAYLKIRIKDEDTIEYQFIGTDDGTFDPIKEAEIKYEEDPFKDDDDLQPCFYTDTNAGPYFLSDFCRDGYPELNNIA
jgi:hypothetical protein